MITRRTLSVGLVAIIMIGLVSTVTYVLAADPKTPGWSDVRDAINKGLPKTAIEKLEPIIERATTQKKYAEAIRGISMKIALEGNIQGNKAQEKIVRMQAEIKKAPAEMKPVMNALLANWYWHYFQQNRWRFQQRTQTAAAPNGDFETWGLARILDEIDKQFQVALKDAEILKKVPVAEYDDLLDRGIAPDTYRPTLFDVLAHNAADFYSVGEQGGSRSINAFDLLAESPVLSSAREFMNWEPDSQDDSSPILKAIKIYQDLMDFHADDQDPTALLDVDLLRLRFGKNKAFGEEGPARYKAALKKFADEHSDHELSSRALHSLAAEIHGEGDFLKALEIATEGERRFSNSLGGRECFNLIQRIKAPSANATTERVWNDPLPTIDVRYRNTTQVHFRLIKFDFEQTVAASNRRSADQIPNTEARRFLTRQPAREWSEELPATDDYKERVEHLKAPDDLEPGSYLLFASHRKDFGDKKNLVSFSEIWVSDLALVTRNHVGKGYITGFVTNAITGEPLPNARIQGWERDAKYKRVVAGEVKSDNNGMFKMTPKQGNFRELMLLASHNGHSLSTANALYGYRNNAPGLSMSVRFFTDRSIYRPGQTIRFKGICLSADQGTDTYKTVNGKKITVTFSDRNNQEIEKIEVVTNDFGSFSGSVTAPRDRLTGQMYLRTNGNARGQAWFRVEEYKRPKFQTELEQPEKASKLGGQVTVKGKATSYTGAAINDAKVSWRVVREVRWPSWWYYRCWWMSPPSRPAQEIAHGVSRTKPDGSFTVKFTAKPDLSILPKMEPNFRYSVYADVTDTTGETRSDQVVTTIGYKALAANVAAKENWLTVDEPISLTLQTTTLDGLGLKAKGTLKIYSLKQPAKVQRAKLSGGYYYGSRGFDNPPPANPTDPRTWETDELVFEKDVETDAAGSGAVDTELAAGLYRIVFTTADRFGKQVEANSQIHVLNPNAKKLEDKIPNLFAFKSASLAPGDEMLCLWGSGYEMARAFVEVEHRGKLLQAFWTNGMDTQVQIKQAVNEAMRGGFIVRTTTIRENRAYMNVQFVDVPWKNKVLDIKWEHMVSKLEPGSKEKWTAIISGPNAEKHAAEMVASLYDASLDAFNPHSWMSTFGVFRRDYSRLQLQFQNRSKSLRQVFQTWRPSYKSTSWNYRRFPAELLQNFMGYQRLSKGMLRRGGGGGLGGGGGRSRALAESNRMESDAVPMSLAKSAPADGPMGADQGGENADKSKKRNNGANAPKLDAVAARKNLNETAFFFPHLISDENGTVKLEFTMPEALTQWKFLGFAHDQELRGGLLTSETVTAKDLMVQPNPPRFVREGDMLEFTVKVSNQSPTRQTGTVRLTFADARTLDSRDNVLGNTTRDQEFQIPSGQSKSLAWRIKVPDDLEFLTYKAAGSTGRLSDGEEGYLPVLSRRILVTESLPLPIRGKQTKQFNFKKLIESGRSDSLKHQSLTVQMVSNPSWYAVMALPYLMEYPHECAEQTFNRLYANSVARYIAASDPKIERIFEQWRNTPALDSPMEKNQDLKAVMLLETPWVQQAQSESQARRNVGILFDQNRLNDEMRRTLHSLTQMQYPDGAWPWFPGGPPSDYITLYITCGFGRMRHLGVDVDTAVALKSINRLDAWAKKRYDAIPAGKRKLNHLSSMVALYLYTRSFFLKDKPVAPQHAEAIDYWKMQGKKFWLELANRQSQGHIALAMKRFGDIKTAKGIMRSIKERSVSDEELGMFWRDTELSWWWYRAPIETQALMIEAFDEVMDDAKAVEDCKVWLLKQKQTQDWKTTKATADAVYSLLLRGTDLLASDALVEVALGGQMIQPKDVEAGTGFYEQRFASGEIKPNQGDVTVKKVDDGVAWGSVHWQYLEDMSKITPHDGTPLKLTKELYLKKNTDKGPTLVKVDGPVEVGDELVVRIVLRTDRDMEYVHLKDYRGSGTEPVNVLSRYRYQDGLGYYESTKDTASHFFIDYLPKGVYVFEYSTRVQLKGKYQTGIANIQCMYAPEFNSHSESLPITVK